MDIAKRQALGEDLVALAFSFFMGVCAYAWLGQLGLIAVGLLLASVMILFVGRKMLDKPATSRVDAWGKGLFTIAGVMALLRHPIEVPVVDPETGAAIGGSGVKLPIYSAIAEYIGQVEPTTFLLFALLAMAVKFSGVISSAFAWHLLLRGQGLRFPFWSMTFTGFLIGRFIGTFLPSTIGLDGYTLYEAGRYSNRWPRVITAKGLEKFIGVTGLFLGMLLTLPFGYQVIVDVSEGLGKPEVAPTLAAAIFIVAGGISFVVILGLVWPVILTWGLGILGRFIPGKVRGLFERFVEAVGAYRGQVSLLLLALSCKFVTHFTTALVYFFTALAIGVVGAEFWPIVFGSTIQILATLLSPTIAGEGAREAFQALLLSKQLGGVAPAVLSGALGFIAAEAATLWGGAFLWTRKPHWRPSFALVDGEQVDYSWIDESDEGGFSADAVGKAQASSGENKAGLDVDAGAR
ncbi:MAG: lysylphosphatidylglycerol synthase transmembrane domain-containing protein [Myxococcota bacterium]|nr:lysylphosphatidylglycerol synthase transmembrane domain-containing protein [Myxococcota bacterium]